MAVRRRPGMQTFVFTLALLLAGAAPAQQQPESAAEAPPPLIETYSVPRYTSLIASLWAGDLNWKRRPSISLTATNLSDETASYSVTPATTSTSGAPQTAKLDVELSS